MIVAGATGDMAPINGTYTFAGPVACIWTAAIAGVTATLQFAPGVQIQLRFFWSPPLGSQCLYAVDLGGECRVSTVLPFASSSTASTGPSSVTLDPL